MTGEATVAGSTLDFRLLLESVPDAYLVLTPDSSRFTIVAVSNAYLRATKTQREEILGRGIFEVFPDNPDDPSATGVQNLRRSLQTVLQNRNKDVMAIQKYDIPRPESEGGGFEERYWSPVNSPVLGADNEVAYIVHRVEDVTQFVQLQQQQNEQHQENQALRVRTLAMEAQIYSRVQELKEVNTERLRVEDERKQAEQRLQLYADVVRNAQVGIVVWQLENLNDPGSFRLLIANPSASKATGINFEQLIGTTMAEHFPMLLQTPLVQHYMNVVRTGVALDLGEVPYSEDGITTGIYSLKAFGLPNHCLALAFENITAQKHTEAQLRESQRLGQQIAETVPGILFVYDLLEQRHTYINRQIWDLLGYTPEQVQAMGAELTHPDDLAHLSAYLEAFHSAPEGAVREVEYRNRHANGEWRWLYTQAVVFDRTVDGIPRQILGVAIDITDRKQAQEALREREQRLDLATKAAELGVFEWNAQTDYAFWENPRMYEIFGQSPEDGTISKAQFIASVLHPDDIEAFEQALQEAIRPGNRFELICRIRRRDGQWRWIEFSGCFSHAPDGTPLRLLSVISDITDRKQAELEIRKFVSLADRSTEFIGMCDMNFVPFYVNEAGRQMVGLDDLRQYSESPVREFFFPEDQDFIVNEFFPRVLRSGRAEVEIRFRHFKTGEALWMIYNVFYIRGENDQPIGLATVSRNITDRKRIEAEREQLLAREQAAREQAETANRIKDEFLAVLSHELRSPLSPILGWSRLLQDRKLDEKRTTYALETIERNAKLQVQLIDDLLDVARILRGKLSLNVTPVNLAATITAAVETVRLAAEAKSIQIQTVLEPDVGRILGDSGRLQQVIWNIMSNAVKFTPQGGRVELRLEQSCTHAQITVSDTGKGIHPDFLPHVFEYFRQADSATTRQFGGLGLGLAIVHQIVELHGGTVQAASPGVGQGATFTVRFPLMQHQSAIPQEVRESKPPSGLQGIKVLVVEDTTDMREYITFVLEQEGAKVVAVATAAQALTVLDQFQPEVLVSDIGMPEVDGYMLLRQMRMRSHSDCAGILPQQGGQIPAIALTAYAGEFDRQQALAAGFQYHLAKPVEPNELVKVILNLL